MKFCTICEQIQDCDGCWKEGRPNPDNADQFEYGIHHRNCVEHYIKNLLTPNVPEPDRTMMEVKVRERYDER